MNGLCLLLNLGSQGAGSQSLGSKDDQSQSTAPQSLAAQSASNAADSVTGQTVTGQTATGQTVTGQSLGLQINVDTFLSDPWFLAALPLGLLASFLSSRKRPRARVGALDSEGLPISLRQRLLFLPPLLGWIGLALLSIAMARPLRANFAQTDVSEGVDILCAIDRSGSMQFEDLEANRSRLAVVKEVVAQFAVRRMTDREGASDSVGLLAFARFPELRCPQTLDVDALTGFLEDVRLVERQSEDGTAIGVALAKAVALLDDSQAKSRVVVLLTDGENNVEDILPLDAARLAADKHVRVYTILAGRYQYVQDMFGGARPVEAELDPSELIEIAAMTGGEFYRARNRQELENIYAEIEKLERTPREHLRSVETRELYAPWLLAGLLTYAAAFGLRSTLGRRFVG